MSADHDKDADGYYFEFKRGQWVRRAGKAVQYQAGGLVYVGHLSKEQAEELDLLINAYLYTTASVTQHGREEMLAQLVKVADHTEAKIAAIKYDLWSSKGGKPDDAPDKSI